MQMTLSGKGSKCRVCTHPDRMQIESMLARGAGIAAIRPMMGDAFSRRALYRHRAKQMIAAQSPAARPIPFPHDGSRVEQIKWLQCEAELTAAMAEQRADLSAKIKALHELSRLVWLGLRSNEQATDDASDNLDGKELDRMCQEATARFEEGQQRARKEAALKGTSQEQSTDS
jgi:hypothetical protein